MTWKIVSTPWADNSTIRSPSDIYAMALGPDNKTFYVADDTTLLKSIDAGYSWQPNISTSLISADNSTSMVWFIETAPDDSNFVVAVTDNASRVFLSTDGGNIWKDTSFPSTVDNISCLAISKNYGGTSHVRDIAVGIRTVPGIFSVYNAQYNNTFPGAWKEQSGLADNITTSIKFSPNYDTDSTIVAISCDNISMRLNLGKHNSSTNTTNWNSIGGYSGYPIPLGVSDSSHIIRSDLELPNDFNADDLMLRGCFSSLYADNATAVHYINSFLSPNVFNITPPLATPPALKGISSIAYNGSETTGILLAGEVGADPAKGLVNIWQCSNAQTTTIGAATWIKSDYIKSPTGGGSTGRANAILAWSEDGSKVYCGTSSENATAGGTGWDPLNPGQWPLSRYSGAQLDESAFSYSTDIGFSWNQLSLIDTNIKQLSDVAALEVPAESSGLGENSILYLDSVSDNSTPGYTPGYCFNSVWRSTSDTLGDRWERILVRNSTGSGNKNILRVNPGKEPRSTAVIWADTGTDNITYSADDGQLWNEPHTGIKIEDVTLTSDETFFVMGNDSVSDTVTAYVRKLTRSGSDWQAGLKINTNLLSPGHSICSPLKNINGEDIIIVGSEGDSGSYIAWADFFKKIPSFTASKQLPQTGDVHVCTDSQFAQNRIVYAGENTIKNDGNIYRWTLGKSTNWELLNPPNSSFLGIDMTDNVLYGIWAPPPGTSSGVNRSLNARINMPRFPEWDNLVSSQLPLKFQPVQFTREPTALKTSVSDYNRLWAIDNKDYDFVNGTGCLWSYIDSISKLGPAPIKPQPADLIPVDPVTGRSSQVDFRWRELPDVIRYDLLVAKDVDFTLPLSQNINFIPVDNVTGAWMIIPADQLSPASWIPPGVLEEGRSYYWKVRASGAVDNETTIQTIHSPWSPVLFFSIRPGFAVNAPHMGPVLFTPIQGTCFGCKTPVRFDWGSMENVKKYEFILAEDSQLQNIIVKSTSTTTAYDYKGQLEFNKPYYWQVRALSPFVSDASPIGVFTLINNDGASIGTAVPISNSIITSSNEFWIWVTIFATILLLTILFIFAFTRLQR